MYSSEPDPAFQAIPEAFEVLAGFAAANSD